MAILGELDARRPAATATCRPCTRQTLGEAIDRWDIGRTNPTRS
ncbi:MAG: hypothetical protein MZV49_13910 [Rhodopseudomonas palustris]|nr:hypothetical protein [Rhodopseudomonas palustris]